MTTVSILVLGSGLVARPCIEYLLRSPKNRVTVGVYLLPSSLLRFAHKFEKLACRTLPSAQALTSSLPRTRAISLDVVSSVDLDKAIAAHQLVISLGPFIYHAAVIKSAIKSKTNVVTTSYVSPAMLELDAAAKEAGIVVLNEVGVDPGVDHFYAIKTIDEVHAKGGKVCAFFRWGT